MSLWWEFLSDLKVRQGDDLLALYISEKTFDELLKAHFDAGQCVPKPSMTSLRKMPCVMLVSMFL